MCASSTLPFAPYCPLPLVASFFSDDTLSSADASCQQGVWCHMEPTNIWWQWWTLTEASSKSGSNLRVSATSVGVTQDEAKWIRVPLEQRPVKRKRTRRQVKISEGVPNSLRQEGDHLG